MPEKQAAVDRLAPANESDDGAASSSDAVVPLGGVLGRLHPLGWVSVALLVAAGLFQVVGTRFLIGNLSWQYWAALVVMIAVSANFAALDLLRRALERLADFTGSISWKLAWLIFLVQLFNVVTRYTNSWFEADILIGQATSLAWMSFGFLFLFGVNHGVKTGVNPRIDFWWAEFSDKKKAWLDFVLHCTLMLPFIFMGVRLLTPYAATSLGRKRDGTWPEGWRVWETWEQSSDADQLPVGPIQAFIVAGFVLWGLQIFAETIKTGFIMIGRNDLGALEVADAPLRVE